VQPDNEPERAGQQEDCTRIEEDHDAVSTLLPGSGLLTVTVPVTVTVPPTGMLPVHLRPVLVTSKVPDEAV
jgi:hypothetical protein